MTTLFEYKGIWYQGAPGTKYRHAVVAVMDTIIEYDENGKASYIKNRRGDKHDFELLRMKTFAEGRVMEDLPKFYDNSEMPYSHSVMGIDENGDLFCSPKGQIDEGN